MYKHTHQIRFRISLFCHTYGGYAILGALIGTALALTSSEQMKPSSQSAHFMAAPGVRTYTVATEPPAIERQHGSAAAQTTLKVFILRTALKTVVAPSEEPRRISEPLEVRVAPAVPRVSVSTRPAIVQEPVTTSPETRTAVQLPERSERAEQRAAARLAASTRPETTREPVPPRVSVAISSEPKKPAAPEVPEDGFPPFLYAVHPVGKVPDWGAMRSPAEWNRAYGEMERGDFVPVPRYDLSVLTEPMMHLAAADPIPRENIPSITAKLYYSTRYFGQYDLDSSEFTAPHPGLDLKLARGTPLGAVGGGKVHRVGEDSRIGLYVMLEHRIPGEGTFFSIYGHLDSAAVKEGDAVLPGDFIGTVGMTGNTTGPHVHLQIDRDDGTRPHVRYQPDAIPTKAEAAKRAINPVEFIQKYARR